MTKTITAAQYGHGHLSTLEARWKDGLGDTLRAMAPGIWPGVPYEAWLGFTSISYGMRPRPGPNNATENTTDGVPGQRGHEVGFFQTPAGMVPGPAPNPDPDAPWNTWGRLHDHIWVTRKEALGRPATMVPDGWKTSLPDQVAVGLADLRAGSRGVSLCLGPSGVAPEHTLVSGDPSPTTWAVALGFLAFSEGGGSACHWIKPYAARLALVPEARRWSALGGMIDADFRAGVHSAPGSKYKTAWTKFESAKQLAHEVGRGAAWDAWYDEPDRTVPDPALWDRLNDLWFPDAPRRSPGGSILGLAAAAAAVVLVMRQ